MFPALSIIYGIASALSWGAGDFAGGLVSRKLSAYRAVFWGDLVGLLLLFVKLIINPEDTPPLKALAIAGLAGALGSFGLLMLYYSMAKGLMSVAAPVSALLAAALPVVVGAFTQGLPSFVQFIGFGLALLAVWLISQGNELRFHIDHLSDLKIPLLAGFGFGLYFVLMHYATEGVSSIVWPMVASRSIGTLMMLVIVLIRRESFSVPRDAWVVVPLNGVLDVGGNLFYILAIQTGRLDISAILSSLYPGATVVLAWLLLRERISKWQALGIGLAIVAIILFTL